MAAKTSSLRVGIDERAGQCAERGQLALAAHASRVFHYDAQHAFDLVVWPGQRTVGEGVIGFFRESAALEDEAQGLVPRCLSGLSSPAQSAGRCRTKSRARLPMPAFQAPRDVFAQGDTGVCIVVEHCELGSPGHPHREARGDEDANRGLKTVGPGGDVAQRSRCPVVGTDQLAHGRGLHRARLAVGLGSCLPASDRLWLS